MTRSLHIEHYPESKDGNRLQHRAERLTIKLRDLAARHFDAERVTPSVRFDLRGTSAGQVRVTDGGDCLVRYNARLRSAIPRRFFPKRFLTKRRTWSPSACDEHSVALLDRQGEREKQSIENNELAAETGQAKPVGWAKQAPVRRVYKASVMPHQGVCEPQRLERMPQARRAHRRGEAACPITLSGTGHPSMRFAPPGSAILKDLPRSPHPCLFCIQGKTKDRV